MVGIKEIMELLRLNELLAELADKKIMLYFEGVELWRKQKDWIKYTTLLSITRQ